MQRTLCWGAYPPLKTSHPPTPKIVVEHVVLCDVASSQLLSSETTMQRTLCWGAYTAVMTCESERTLCWGATDLRCAAGTNAAEEVVLCKLCVSVRMYDARRNKRTIRTGIDPARQAIPSAAGTKAAEQVVLGKFCVAVKRCDARQRKRTTRTHIDPPGHDESSADDQNALEHVVLFNFATMQLLSQDAATKRTLLTGRYPPPMTTHPPTTKTQRSIQFFCVSRRLNFYRNTETLKEPYSPADIRRFGRPIRRPPKMHRRR